MDLMMSKPDRSAVDEAGRAVAAAKQETADACGRAGQLASALEGAESAYDRDPTEENGRAVIAAREARDLAVLRNARAERREQAARAQLAAVEKDLALEEARYAVCLAKVDAACKAHDLERAKDRAAADVEVEQLRNAAQILRETTQAIAKRVAAAAAAHVAELRRVDAALAKVIALSAEPPPDVAQELAEVRAEIGRLEAARVSARTFHAHTAPLSAMIAIGAALVRDGVEGARAALADMRERAEAARAAGLRVDVIDGAHAAAAALIALQEAIPDMITKPGIAALLTRQVLVQGDVSGAARRAAIASPLRSLLSVWGRALEAGPLDDQAPEELAEAKLSAALSANTEHDAARAVDAAHQAWRAKEAAEQRVRARRDAAERGEALEATTIN